MKKVKDNRYNRFMIRKKITIIVGAVAAIMIGYFGASQIYDVVTGTHENQIVNEATANSEESEIAEVIFDDESISNKKGAVTSGAGVVVTGGAIVGGNLDAVDIQAANTTEINSTDIVGTVGNESDGTTKSNTMESANISDSTDFMYTKEEISSVKRKVKSSAVKALVLFDSDSYNGYSDEKTVNGSFSKGDEIEIIRDRGAIWYKGRRLSDGFEGWISSDALTIPKDPATNTSDLTKREKECYVNSKDFSSKTKLFVWVDIDRQETNIFSGEKNKWTLNKTFSCATGLNISPTVRGVFEAGNRGEWFYTDRFASGAKYYTSFSGSYLFHSVSMDKDKNITDPTLGKRVSNGCVRLAVDDAKWIYDNVVAGTKIYIY